MPVINEKEMYFCTHQSLQDQVFLKRCGIFEMSASAKSLLADQHNPAAGFVHPTPPHPPGNRGGRKLCSCFLCLPIFFLQGLCDLPVFVRFVTLFCDATRKSRNQWGLGQRGGEPAQGDPLTTSSPSDARRAP